MLTSLQHAKTHPAVPAYHPSDVDQRRFACSTPFPLLLRDQRPERGQVEPVLLAADAQEKLGTDRFHLQRIGPLRPRRKWRRWWYMSVAHERQPRTERRSGSMAAWFSLSCERKRMKKPSTSRPSSSRADIARL